jgi:hypothetical protein
VSVFLLFAKREIYPQGVIDMKKTTIHGALLLISIFIMASATIAHAQGKQMGSAAILTDDGALFVRNDSDKSFMIEIKSKNFKTLTAGNNPAFLLDGKLVQVVIVPLDNFMEGVKGAGDDKILDLHQKWESDYLQNEMYRAKFSVESEKTSANDRKLLFWGFKRPGMAKEYERDCFLTTVIGNRVFGLSSPVRPGESVADYKKLLLEIFSTLKVSDEPFDIGKIADQVRKGTYKGD